MGGVSGLVMPGGEEEEGLCLLVRLVDWLAPVHDHWFAGGAFTGWGHSRSGRGFSDVMQ